jgi:hypothetical protein
VREAAAAGVGYSGAYLPRGGVSREGAGQQQVCGEQPQLFKCSGSSAVP